MSRHVDEREHSMELHLPYIHRKLQLTFPGRPASEYPPLVPIMVGSTNAEIERAVGALLAPYLADQSNAFIISSDFCHWGQRFAYTYYVPDAPQQKPILPLSFDHLPQPPTSVSEAKEAISAVSGRWLRSNRELRTEIYDSISAVDIATMKAITTGSTAQFLKILKTTGNTVCGRHPIGVIMAALEEFASATGDEVGKFHFISTTIYVFRRCAGDMARFKNAGVHSWEDVLAQRYQNDKPSSLPRYRRRKGNIRGPAPRGLDITRQPDQQPQCLLLNRLPPELRLAIWEIVLGNLQLHIIQRSHRRLGCVVCPQNGSCDICRGVLLQPVKNIETCSKANLLSLLVTCKQM
ncbi:hypothetical protein UA08_00112 [Talaromyces atroroseus]|uniref:DUF7730 domain-containing protein n=1 Tax=Talaromyces atroroseus TaxID=1441469 RepID=A0A225B936_TALAT|nr:hypothetical protein UA08_00112 [Talaromyces atroroseus]OKL64599.1 hypothetical protein UA08_00112 [Talaromyces atroroseus]